ncbi:hypothetical protein Hanom_Chr12g01123021 [Helianthus anomalus]
MTLDLNLCLGNGMYVRCSTHVKVKNRFAWGQAKDKCGDVIRGLMEFKELFGSFTGHRVENRSTGMRYGSTGSTRS